MWDEAPGEFVLSDDLNVELNLIVTGGNIDSAGAALVLNDIANQAVQVGSGTVNWASGDGDLYVQSDLEVDDNAHVAGYLDVDTYVDVDQANSGTTPSLAIDDLRAGVNNDDLVEAAAVINAAGTYALYVQTGQSQFVNDVTLEDDLNMDQMIYM